MLSFIGPFEQKGITPNISLPDIPVPRNLDKSALSRIFGNVVSNAVKYSDGDFSVKMDGDGKTVFSNTAKGLSKADLGKLFDRFYTVDSARKSTGLGLSIAKLLTEKMGGSITAEYKNETLYITVCFENRQ